MSLCLVVHTFVSCAGSHGVEFWGLSGLQAHTSVQGLIPVFWEGAPVESTAPLHVH